MVMLTAQPQTLMEWWFYYMERAAEARRSGNYRAARRMIRMAAEVRLQQRWAKIHEIH